MNDRATGRIVRSLLDWFSANARDLPWRCTRDPYAIWVSEIMLQQTQVKTVIPYWERWMRELPTIDSLAKARPPKIHKLWEGLGYYTRVRNLQKAAQQIIAISRSRRREEAEISPLTKPSASSPRRPREYTFPENFDDILALPGVGRYTAGAIASIAFNQPRPILDGNVIRVVTRVYGIKTDPREKKTNAQLWQLAEELVSHAKDAESAKKSNQKPLRPSRPLREDNSCSFLNQSLMELGALICTPRSPRCEVCPVNKLCIARKQNLQEQLPNLGKREVATQRRFVAFIVERKGRFLVRQRPAGGVNAHLWEFPNAEVGARLSSAAALSSAIGSREFQPALINNPLRLGQPRSKATDFRIVSAKPFCTIKHSITRYRITLEAWRAILADSHDRAPVSELARFKTPTGTRRVRRPALQGKWLTLRQLHKLAFTSAHKKILSQIEERC